jgi:hypothetical protein
MPTSFEMAIFQMKIVSQRREQAKWVYCICPFLRVKKEILAKFRYVGREAGSVQAGKTYET